MQRITFPGLIEKMARMPEEIDIALKAALTKSAVQVHITAVEKFGNYQPEYGPYQAWAVLSPVTLKQKLKAGAAQDDPLIGHYAGKRKSIYPTALRQSITMQVSHYSAQVGTNDPIGKWQEFGTRHIPPRPFLRPALYQNEEWIRKTIKEAIGLGLIHFMK